MLVQLKGVHLQAPHVGRSFSVPWGDLSDCVGVGLTTIPRHLTRTCQWTSKPQTLTPKLLRRGSQALVHWWYLPDSYDELYPADKASENVEPDKVIEGRALTC